MSKTHDCELLFVTYDINRQSNGILVKLANNFTYKCFVQILRIWTKHT